MWEEGVRIYGTPGVSNNFPIAMYLKFTFPPFMGEEGVCIYGTPGVPNNFPIAMYLKFTFHAIKLSFCDLVVSIIVSCN